jgi:hypothetical protein
MTQPPRPTRREMFILLGAVVAIVATAIVLRHSGLHQP